MFPKKNDTINTKKLSVTLGASVTTIKRNLYVLRNFTSFHMQVVKRIEIGKQLNN